MQSDQRIMWDAILKDAYNYVSFYLPCNGEPCLKEKSKAANVLSKIYDPLRLEDELHLLAAAAEEERKKPEVHISDVFREIELRLAFIAGGGLLDVQTIVTRNVF